MIVPRMDGAGAHQLFRDGRDRAFSLAMRRSFASFGAHSRLSLPIELRRVERIAVGNGVYFGPGCWLMTHEPSGRIVIGDGTSIAGYCVLSAATEIEIGRRVLFARNVYIGDHRHGFHDPNVAVLDQPLGDLRPIRVADGAWLGQNVVLLPGVTIGRNAVVGANSVVRDDVPAGSVAVGAPARVVRRRDEGPRTR